MLRYSRVAAVIAAAGTLFAASEAYAADCNFGGQTVVYVTGSSASSPYLAALSQVMAAQTPPSTLVYIQTESCQGVTAFTTATPVTAAATYWTANPDGGAGIVANTCNFSATSTPATQVTVDASVSDVFAATCPNVTVSATQKEIGGPVQAMAFVVHPNSTESSISQEAAHVVFKDIGTASQQISPWTDPAQLFIRQGGANGSGTRGMIGTALGFADSDWSSAIPAANILTGSGALQAAVAADSANASKSLGILSVTKADAARVGSTSTQQVKVLAFQAKGQSCGYLPDSSAQTFDKINVREGRYDIWGPLHFITAVSGGKPVSSSNPTDAATNAAVQSFVNLVSLAPGATLTDTQKKAVITAAASAHVVAQCAMRVQRSGEVGVEASFLPPESCGCFWEAAATGKTPASCSTCTADTDCTGKTGTPTCRYGFCEAQ